MADYEFRPDERPLMLGSPYAPDQPTRRRLAYAGVAIVVGLCSSFSNALIQVNTNTLGGALGLDAAQMSLLPAMYVAANASSNLMLVKCRFQFGPMRVMYTAVGIYLLAALIEALVPGYYTAIVTRMACGLAASSLTTLTIYNMLQAFPPKIRPLALIIGIVIPQFATPFARMVPVELLSTDSWFGLHVIEITTALIAMIVPTLLPLPPTDRLPAAFERLDFVSIALLVPGFFLVCAVLGMGRPLWWADTPWLGWALACGVAFLAAGLLVERRRVNPLLQLRWLGTLEIARFAVVAFLVRVALAEQTYGAVGLLQQSGLTNDQLRELFGWVALAMVAGAAVAMKLLDPARLALPIAIALFLIAIGSAMDSQSNSLTRPEQLYVSQSLIGCGLAMFIGPSLIYGLLRAIKRGPTYLPTLIVTFSSSQNIGGLAGSALLGSLQYYEVQRHTQLLMLDLDASNPLVAERLRGSASSLRQVVSRDANVLAFNDVFGYVAIGAALVGCYLAARVLYTFIQERREANGSLATHPTR